MGHADPRTGIADAFHHSTNRSLYIPLHSAPSPVTLYSMRIDTNKQLWHATALLYSSMGVRRRRRRPQTTLLRPCASALRSHKGAKEYVFWRDCSAPNIPKC